jgi:mono/diheme cytochrome c family protein
MATVDVPFMKRIAALLFLVACAAMFCLVLSIAVGYEASPPAPGDRVTALVPVDDDPQGSTVVVAERRGGGTLAIVGDTDEQAVVLVDLATRTVIGRAPLGGTPAQLLVTREGALLVALRDRARVAVMELRGGRGELRERASMPTCDEPFGLAEAPDGTVLVTCAMGHALQGFDAAALTRRFTVDLPREPRSVRVSRRFRRAYIAHVAAPLLSVVDLASPERGFATFGVVAAPLETRHGLLVPDPVQGYALAGFGDVIAAPHARAVTGDATVRTRSSYGGEGTAAVGAERAMTAVVLDRAEPRVVFGPATACILPRAAVFVARALVVACADGDRLERLRGPLVRPAFAEQVLPMDGFGLGITSSEFIPAGAGITGLAVDPTEQILVAWAQEDGVLEVMRMPEGGDPAVLGNVHVERTGDDAAAARLVALGRRIFHTSGDRRIARDGRACASCHPDGLDDGLTWATPDGPRQTPTLRGRVEGTAPYGWLGRRGTLPAHIEQTIQRLGGQGLLNDEVGGLVAYLMSMQTPARHVVADGPTVQQGAAVFAEVCASCHQPATDFSDGETHNVRSRVKGDLLAEFDTPSLRRADATAPYFHDGRYGSLRDVLVGTHGTMWHEPAGGLAPRDFEALLTYVRSL